MKILLDTCVWGGAYTSLKSAGYDVVWAGNWKEDPGDDEILAYAHRESRILVTLDKDFGELAIVYRIPHSGIVRLVNIAARQQATVCLRILTRHGETLRSGAIVTAYPHRIRIRLPNEM